MLKYRQTIKLLVMKYTHICKAYITSYKCSLFSPLKTKMHLNCIEIFDTYRAVKSVRHGFKCNQLMLCKKIIPVASKNDTKHTHSWQA
jgi:hypothetical protein